jgi:uncharacterized membrane protein YqaE (UPF0057 family)
MSRRVYAWALIGLGLVCAVVGFLHFFEWHESETTLPPRGEARYNPMFALGKALRLRGHEVHARATLNLDAMQLQPGDVLLLASDVRSIGEDTSDELVGWIYEGGHLVFALPDVDADRTPPLIEQLGLVLSTDAGCVRWQGEGAKAPASLCARSGLIPNEDDEDDEAEDGQDEDDYGAWTWSWRDEDGIALMARADAGDGSWLALPGFDLFARRALEDPNHAALTWALLAPLLQEKGRVHLVYAVDLPPLYVLLVERGWPLWIPLLLMLLAWLWRRSQRLGPMLPLAPPDRRALLEHVRAAGEFALRRKRGAALHAALRRRFDARLAREAPMLAALEGEAQVLALASTWRLDPVLVRSALQPGDLTRPDQFAAAIRSLSQLQAPP